MTFVWKGRNVVFRSPVCDIRTCEVCNLFISLVERGTDGRHVSNPWSRIRLSGYNSRLLQFLTHIVRNLSACFWIYAFFHKKPNSLFWRKWFLFCGGLALWGEWSRNGVGLFFCFLFVIPNIFKIKKQKQKRFLFCGKWKAYFNKQTKWTTKTFTQVFGVFLMKALIKMR